MGVTKRVAAGAVLLAGLVFSTVQAQNLPKIAEFYFDDDVAAKPIQAVPPGQADLVDQLMKLRERGRKGLEATVQLAGVAYAEGRTELGAKLYSEALATVSDASVQARGLRWNQAWDLYRHGDSDGALQLWTTAAENVRGNPSWMPQTMALVLWKLGRKDEALAWYAAAVRTEPQQWNDPARFAELLPLWQDNERAQLAEVQQAWAANPPSWP
ncbi:tetratricopeptide repeat protein [Stenotrophomonas sp. SY1]|uniref:tetratricopeptide repeat protein n=1 Tax=Stenotrophomonas sp. SY1 TaxID=477235 RepID=UPI001E35B8C2|nr:tetratricopeptide repeat protein [Stenotrophomonas sp. SY1]MCD9088548.1 tetratricopeptide repeat protein [Stenotrophomonas sp. SY1]